MTGSLASTIGELNPIRYRSYFYDSEINMYYLNSRYYSPDLCRFLNADGICDTNTGMLSHNMLAYCNNNPVNMIDSNGTFGILTVLAIISVGVISGIIVGLTAACINLYPKKAAETVISKILPETDVITKPKNTQKNMDSATQKKKQHAQNVVNTGYATSKKKTLPLISIDKNIFESDQCYMGYCQTMSVALDSYTQTVCDFSVSGKSWNQLTWDQQQTVIDTMPSWDAEISLDIGKQTAKQTTFDILF